jgi:hypothetical protein
MTFDALGRAALEARHQAIADAKLAFDHKVAQASLEYRNAVNAAYYVWDLSNSDEVVTAP